MIALFSISSGALAVTARAVDATNVSSGVYTAPQATRGESLYLDECASCHGATLRGVGEFGGPGLLGERFLMKWRGLTVGDLFELTKTTMPKDSPSRLDDQQYADIIAFVLKSNEFPAGASELSFTLSELKLLLIDEVKQ